MIILWFCAWDLCAVYHFLSHNCFLSHLAFKFVLVFGLFALLTGVIGSVTEKILSIEIPVVDSVYDTNEWMTVRNMEDQPW